MIGLSPDRLFRKEADAPIPDVPVINAAPAAAAAPVAAEAAKAVEKAPLLSPEAIHKVPAWMLGGTLGAGLGAFIDDEDRARGALQGGLLGAGLGLATSALPRLKFAYLAPSFNLPGGLGMRTQQGERLPGTHRYVEPEMLERAGKILDEGGSVPSAVQEAQKVPEGRYLPIAGAVLGGLGGRWAGGLPGTAIGAGVGGVAGWLGQRQVQSGALDKAREAVKGLLIERARMGDTEAQQLLLTHYA